MNKNTLRDLIASIIAIAIMVALAVGITSQPQPAASAQQAFATPVVSEPVCDEECELINELILILEGILAGVEAPEVVDLTDATTGADTEDTETGEVFDLITVLPDTGTGTTAQNVVSSDTSTEDAAIIADLIAELTAILVNALDGIE